jgi:hypothetical protein
MIIMHHAPESATMSFWERPCAAKREVRLARPDVGGGMLLLAPLKPGAEGPVWLSIA